MKKIRFIAVLLFMGVVVNCALAQNTTEKMQLKQSVNKLFDSCKSRDYNSVAKLTVYSGNNAGRNLKASLNPKDRNELKKAKRIGKKVSALLMVADKFAISGIVTRKNGSLKKYLVDVVFDSGGQKLKTEFVFVKAGGSFLLYEID